MTDEQNPHRQAADHEAPPEAPSPPPLGSGGPATATATEEGPPSAPRPPRPVFRRTVDDKVVAGVAGGLARTFDVDPVVVRIITVVTSLAFPPVLVAYLAAWLLVARDDEPSRPPAGGIAFRQTGGVAFWVGVVVLAALALAALEGPFRGSGFDLLPLVLIGIGVALWTRDGSRGRPAPAATPPPVSVDGGDGADGADGAVPPTGPPARPEPDGPPPAGPPPPPPPRSPLGAITIALALIATGVVAALDQVEGVALDADGAHLAAVALLVLGLGQLVGALWGRARWLTLVAVFLIPPVAVGTAVREFDPAFALTDGIAISDGIGERVLRPGVGGELPEDIRLLAGSVRIDLEDWQPSSGELAALAADDSDLVISIGAGEVVLTTPTAVPWRVVADIGLGDAAVTRDATLLEQQTTEEIGRPLQVVRTGGPQDGPVLDILVDLRVGNFDLHTPPLALPDDLQELS